MRSMLCATAFTLILTACGQQESIEKSGEPALAPVEKPAEDAVATEPPGDVPPVTAAARTKLAEALGISEEQIEVLETRSVAWRSSALGCPDPDKMYAQVITQGWFVRLTVGQIEYRYHAGLDGVPFTCNPGRAESPLELAVE